MTSIWHNCSVTMLLFPAFCRIRVRHQAGDDSLDLVILLMRYIVPSSALLILILLTFQPANEYLGAVSTSFSRLTQLAGLLIGMKSTLSANTRLYLNKGGRDCLLIAFC